MEDIAAATQMFFSVSELDGLLLQRDRRHVQMMPAALLQEVAGEVIFMQALHDHNDGARLFVIEPRDQCAAILIDHSLPARLRMELVGVQGVVDDDQIGTASGKRSAN
jgi:hypothetical protein